LPIETSDVAIVGAGIVGLATADAIARRHPGFRVVVLEKEDRVAAHQTGRNSGVIHSGIYYKPGSLKARCCIDGRRRLIALCEEEGIAHDVCGKVIVAVDDRERPMLEAIFRRGQANGVRCALIDRARLRELEPHAAGIAAIHVEDAGIVSYADVCEKLAARLRRRGRLLTGARVRAIHKDTGGRVVETDAGAVHARYVINCAGLHADRVAAQGGAPRPAQIVPFRGEYYALSPSAARLCKNLIYPVPDPSFPFLGVHFTRMIEGGVECGPNAVLAFAREGYRFRDVDAADLLDTLLYPGFLRLAARHARTGVREMWRSLSKAAFVRTLQRLVPEIDAADLTPAPAGVRAQAVGRDGSMIDDFVIRFEDRVVDVCNAPSPAATASLAVADAVVDALDRLLGSTVRHAAPEARGPTSRS